MREGALRSLSTPAQGKQEPRHLNSTPNSPYCGSSSPGESTFCRHQQEKRISVVSTAQSAEISAHYVKCRLPSDSRKPAPQEGQRAERVCQLDVVSPSYSGLESFNFRLAVLEVEGYQGVNVGFRTLQQILTVLSSPVSLISKPIVPSM